MADSGKRIYQFGPFRIDSVERLLYRGGEMIPLTPKVVDTLLALVSNAGRVMEKDELMRAIWPDSFVEEGGLARNISLLRRVFETAADGGQYVETIPKRGYRFVGLLTEPQAAPGLGSPATRSPAPPAKPNHQPHWEWIGPAVLLVAVLIFGYFWLGRHPRIPSLVVLPLKDLSGDAAIAEGIHDEINNILGTIGSLHVIAQTTAMTYQGSKKPVKAIAQELGVDAVIEGTVRQSGDRIHIGLQLVEAKTETELWANSWEGALRDVEALGREVARGIAAECRVKLTPGERARLSGSRAVKAEAFRNYQYGRFYWNKRTPEGVQKALAYFQQAIQEDPSWAVPYAGLADALAQMGTNGSDAAPPKSVMPRAKAAALQAVALDNTLAEAHTSLGNIKMAYDWDLEGAHREFQHAVELNPGYPTAHHWYAHYWLAMGQTDKALHEIQVAQDLDPLSLVINVGAGFCLYQAGKFDEAIEQYRSTVNMDPTFPLAHSLLGMAWEAKKLYPQAIDEYNKALALPGSPGLAMAGLGASYALSGNPREARHWLDQMTQTAKKQYVPAMYFAVVHTAFGDKDQGIEWTRKAFDERSDYMINLRTEPRAAGLRTDARFQELLNQVARGGR